METTRIPIKPDQDAERRRGVIRWYFRLQEEAMSVRPADEVLQATYSRLRSVSAVAAELDVAFETARRWLVQAGIRLQPKGRPSASAERLSTAELKRRYKKGESIAQLGRAFGVSPATVRSRLIDAGVELRPRPGWKY
jgi:hypothetical protein